MNGAIITSMVGLCASISSIVFSLLAFKRSEKEDHKSEGKNEGFMMSDIGYIKACVERVEKNLTKVDERYKDVLERLAKVEESLQNVIKRVDEIPK